MIKLLNNFSRVLCALLLCAGLVVAGCTEGPLGDDQNTEQGGNQNNGNENGGDSTGGSQDKPADENEVKSGPVTITIDEITATTVTFKGKIDVSDADKDFSQVTIRYSEPDGFNAVDETLPKVVCTSFDENNEFNIVLTGLNFNTVYKYCVIAKVRTVETYSEKVMSFTTGNVSVSLSDASSITATTAQISGTVEGLSETDKSRVEVGMFYSAEEGKVENGQGSKLTASAIASDNAVSFSLSKLSCGTTYYYCSYVKRGYVVVYSEVKTFVAGSVSVNLSAGSITATTAQISGTIEGLSESDKSQIQVGMIYSAAEGKVENGQGSKKSASAISSDNAVSFSLSQLTFGTTYYYCSYVQQGTALVYGEVKTFVTGNVSVSVSAKESTIISGTPVAEFTGTVTGLLEEDKSYIEVGVAYCTTSEGLKTRSSTKIAATIVGSDGVFEAFSNQLSVDTTVDTKYYYCSYVKQNSEYIYGTEINELQTIHPYRVPSNLNVSSATDLSSSATANCYIVSKGGLYKFKTVKGNSSESVGNIASASILWEALGTSTTPELLQLIKSCCYRDGYIAFKTADTFKEGNAVIAAKDANGNILWSWHIWLTDQPQGQVYYNNAGTMMDRNLGATSATPGDVGALGLLYQWGRKDPFLGSSSISSYTIAKSTITWPSHVSSKSKGTIAYATANPTTFIGYNSSNRDWYYTGDSSTDNTRWTTSESNKSIYDPCPVGWRVPDGGENGVWSKALGSSSNFRHTYNGTNGGMNFSGKFGSASSIWYPASGSRNDSDSSLFYVGFYGFCWSASPDSNEAYYLNFYKDGSVRLSDSYNRAHCFSVRCIKE